MHDIALCKFMTSICLSPHRITY